MGGLVCNLSADNPGGEKSEDQPDQRTKHGKLETWVAE